MYYENCSIFKLNGYLQFNLYIFINKIKHYFPLFLFGFLPPDPPPRPSGPPGLPPLPPKAPPVKHFFLKYPYYIRENPLISQSWD